MNKFVAVDETNNDECEMSPALFFFNRRARLFFGRRVEAIAGQFDRWASGKKKAQAAALRAFRRVKISCDD